MSNTSALGDVIRPGTTRGLDFIVIDELRKRTGVSPDSVLKFALSEILCNALDKDATEIGVDIQVDGDFYRLAVRDNGSKKLTLRDIKLILQFENKASSKRGFLRVSRGYLGNALKCIVGYSYALAESKGLTPPDIIVESGRYEYIITLKPDRVRGIIKSDVVPKRREDDGFTTFTVKFPTEEESTQYYGAPCPSNPWVLENLILATGMVNPTRKITYNTGEEGVVGSAEGGRSIRQETSVLWYTSKQFSELFEDFLRARPETQLKEIIPLFRGFSSKKIIGEILQNFNSGNHHSKGSNNVQFFPATPIKDLSKAEALQLFTVMRSKAKPIAKRSIPSVLGVVGEEAFEKLREENGWERLRYIMMSSFEIECPYLRDHYNDLEGSFNDVEWSCDSAYHVEFPYLVEIAVFDREEDVEEGLKVYQCVNFMASTEDIFSRLYNINYHLGRVGIKQDNPVTVLVHLVSPVLKWLNYGKSGLDE